MKTEDNESYHFLGKIIQIQCADCGCLPAECRESKSPKKCPNCTWDECCCWDAIRS